MTDIYAEYNSPSEPKPKNFLELSDDMIEIIRRVGVEVANAHSREEAHDKAQLLNDALYSEGVLGRTARLRSEFVTMSSYEVVACDGGLVRASIDTTTSEGQYEGVFVGCDVGGITRELVYRIELPFTTEELQFRSVIAAVDHATLLIEASAIKLLTDDESLQAPIVLLESLDDEIVTANLVEMMNLLNIYEMVDAELLNSMASLAIEMMERPVFMNNQEAHSAVMKLFTPLVDQGDRCSFVGVEHTVKQLPNGRRELETFNAKASGDIHAIAPTQNFDINDKSADSTNLMQPSFIFLDDNKVEHIVPLRHLTFFEHNTAEAVIAVKGKGDDCDISRTRFLEKYPDIFDTSSSRMKKFIKHVLKKYFQNGDSGV